MLAEKIQALLNEQDATNLTLQSFENLIAQKDILEDNIIQFLMQPSIKVAEVWRLRQFNEKKEQFRLNELIKKATED